MMNLLISLLVFALIFGGALAGMAVSAVVVGTALALGLQGRRKADRGPDWHTHRTRTGSVDRIRKNYVRPENKPGQADDRNGHPSGRSAYAIRTGSNLSLNAPAAEHTTDG